MLKASPWRSAQPVPWSCGGTSVARSALSCSTSRVSRFCVPGIKPLHRLALDPSHAVCSVSQTTKSISLGSTEWRARCMLARANSASAPRSDVTLTRVRIEEQCHCAQELCARSCPRRDEEPTRRSNKRVRFLTPTGGRNPRTNGAPRRPIRWFRRRAIQNISVTRLSVESTTTLKIACCVSAPQNCASCASRPHLGRAQEVTPSEQRDLTPPAPARAAACQ